MSLSNVKYTKNIKDFLFENIAENIYEYEDENPPFHSEAGKVKGVQQTLE